MGALAELGEWDLISRFSATASRPSTLSLAGRATARPFLGRSDILRALVIRYAVLDDDPLGRVDSSTVGCTAHFGQRCQTHTVDLLLTGQRCDIRSRRQTGWVAVTHLGPPVARRTAISSKRFGSLTRQKLIFVNDVNLIPPLH